MNNKGKNDNDFLTWGIIAVCFVIGLWPISIFLLIKKFLPAFINGLKSTRSTDSVNDTSYRFDRYRQIVEGNDSMPIEVIASAAGVSYETALREIRQMVSEGKFGPEAYINYLTKTLVLKASAGQASPKSAARPAGTKPGMAGYTPVSSLKKGEGKGGGALSVLGVIMIAFGAIIGSVALGMIADAAMSAGGLIWISLTALFCILAGIGALVARGKNKKRQRRFTKYLAVIGSKKLMDLEQLARAAGVNEETTVKDLEAMIDKGYFDKSAYVDLGLGSLILSPDARPEYKAPDPERDAESQYASILREIRNVNDRIADEQVSERIYKIEDITAKIFKIVEDKPEKQPQIKSFMSYYLPTTLKLLDSYATFEKQGITGENIDSARMNIEKTLDTLVQGFSQQLDQLFTADVLDISADIDVLENMMKKDGLTGGDDFQVAQSH